LALQHCRFRGNGKSEFDGKRKKVEECRDLWNHQSKRKRIDVGVEFDFDVTLRKKWLSKNTFSPVEPIIRTY
jgi:hypothetical protein